MPKSPGFRQRPGSDHFHPTTKQTAFRVGRTQGQEAAKGNLLPLNDLMIAAAAIEQGYAVLTENQRHFHKVPGLTVVTL